MSKWLVAATRTRYERRSIFRSVAMVMVVTWLWLSMAIIVAVAVAVAVKVSSC